MPFRLFRPLLIFVTLLLVGCTSGVDKRLHEELMADPNRYPLVINAVFPEPGTTTSLSLGTDYATDICVGLDNYDLMEPGDHISTVDDVTLSLDGNLVADAEVTHVTLLDLIFRHWDDGQQATGSSSDTVCWQDTLTEGIHIANFTVWTTRGVEYNYEWAFEVTE